MNTQPSTPLTVDYYSGAYGPTIHIALNSIEQVATLYGILRSLAKGDSTEVDLQALPEIRLSGLRQFFLNANCGDDAASKSLTVVTDNAPVARWCQSRDGWQRSAGLVEAFLDDDRPGHQYLTREGVDDAIVEVAYKE